jgi:hypothetical protein
VPDVFYGLYFAEELTLSSPGYYEAYSLKPIIKVSLRKSAEATLDFEDVAKEEIFKTKSSASRALIKDILL